MQYFVLKHMFCIAGKFFTVDGDIVSTLKFGVDTKFLKYFNNGFCVALKVNNLRVFAGASKRKVEVAQIVVNSTTTGKSANHFNAFFLYIIHINLRQGVLMLTNN